MASGSNGWIWWNRTQHGVLVKPGADSAPSEAAEVLIDRLSGSGDIVEIAEAFDVSVAQLRRWCERTRIRHCRCLREHGNEGVPELRVTQTVNSTDPTVSQRSLKFTLDIANLGTASVSNGRVAQRSFTSAGLDCIEFDSGWRLLQVDPRRLGPGETCRYAANDHVTEEDCADGEEIISAITISGRGVIDDQRWA